MEEADVHWPTLLLSGEYIVQETVVNTLLGKTDAYVVKDVC